jgi:hypothetical protein
MAEPIVRTFEIDTAKSEQNLRQLGSALDSADNAGKSLKAQLRELQAQLANTDPQTQKYRDLSQAAGELKDKISDAAQAVGTQAGGAFERVSGSLGLVTSRLTSLDFSGAAEGAKLFANNLASIKPAELANGIKSVGSALASVGKALLTNPLFLLGGAIVLIVTNLDKLASVIPGVGAALEAIGNVVSFIVDGVKSLSDAILGTEFIANDVLNKSIEQRDQSLKEFDQQEKRAIANAKKNGESIAAVEEKYAQERIKTYQKIIDEAAYLTSQGTKLTEDQVKAVQEANSALFDIETQRILKEAELAEQARKEEERKQQEAIERRKKIAEEAKRKRDEAIKKENEERLRNEKEISDLLNQLYEENVKEFEEAEKKKTQAAQEEAAKRQKAEEDYDAAIKALRAEQDAANLTQDQLDIIAIDNKYLDLREKAIQAGQSTVEVDAAYKAALEQQEIDSAERRKANEFAVQDAKLQATSDALGAINGLVAAFAKGDEQRAKRAFQIQKAVSIAQATVDTYKGANAIFASAAANPATVLFPAQPFIAAGVAVAAGLANVATIASQQFQGSGSTPGNNNTTPPSFGGGGGADTGAQPATFNPFAAQFVTNRPDQYTPRAYVLAGDVSSQQEVRENVEDLARIG